jgi:ribosomal protein S18 acetylase RimI-like enzyme
MIGTPSQYTKSKLVGEHSPTSLEKGGYFMNLQEGSEIVGSLYVKKYMKSYVIRDVFVKPEFRGKGYGKQLLMGIIDFLRPKGLPILLYVDPSNGIAISLYESIGFKLTKKNTFQGDKFSLQNIK